MDRLDHLFDEPALRGLEPTPVSTRPTRFGYFLAGLFAAGGVVGYLMGG